MLMNERWLVKGESMLYWSWCYIGCEALVTLSSPSEAPLWGRSNSRSPPTFGPLEIPEGPRVSVSYCSHCTHRILHLHVAHGGVWGGFRPVRQFLVAAGLRIQQVGQWTQLKVVSICKNKKKGIQILHRQTKVNATQRVLCHYLLGGITIPQNFEP